MTELLISLALVLLILVIILQVLHLRKQVTLDLAPLENSFQAVKESHERTERAVREEIARNRDEANASARLGREEAGKNLKDFTDSVVRTMGEMASMQRKQLADIVEQLQRLTESNEKKLDAVKTAVEEKLKSIQQDNAKQLDQMRATVDEKLQGTLEKRLGESFKLVGERLEQVYKGLGEMQALAVGVGDLKKVLSNVKTRGTWGEVQLEALLEQVMHPDQYAANVDTRGSGERVEFAIKLPGRGMDKADVVWLPIDAKFPVEDYQRLVEAQEKGDLAAAEEAGKLLENRIKLCASDICNKYIGPPRTTDFGILFLPIEGLFAEVVRRIGLMQYVQQECHVMIAGPTTLYAILNSLQMGFRTLAIQKRSGEVWDLLAAVKTEFGKYGEVLDKVKKKLNEASNALEDDVARRTRVIQSKLRHVQELPSADADSVLSLGNGDGMIEEET